MQFRRSARREVTINIAPLVDVVFLLVIFFAVSTTFLDTAGLKLELPASSSTAQRETRDLTVLLAADGSLTFDGQAIEPDALAATLREAIADTERKVVTLRADTATSHGDVVHVMDLIRESGAEGLVVAARAKPAE